jgi:hypothetical protein
MPNCERCGNSTSDNERVVVALNRLRYEGRLNRGSDPVPAILCPKCAKSYLGLFRFCMFTALGAIATIALLKMVVDWLNA